MYLLFSSNQLRGPSHLYQFHSTYLNRYIRVWVKMWFNNALSENMRSNHLKSVPMRPLFSAQVHSLYRQDRVKGSYCKWEEGSQAFCDGSSPCFWISFPEFPFTLLSPDGKKKTPQSRTIVFLLLGHKNIWVTLGGWISLPAPVLPCLLVQPWPTSTELLPEKWQSPKSTLCPSFLFPTTEQGVHFSVVILKGRPL